MDWRSFNLNSILCLVLPLLAVRGREIKADEVCQICDGCIYGSISCQEAGRLHMLPNDLPPGIRKVIIVSQRFDSQFLSRQNISSYSLPGTVIQELTIMDCGLRAIESRTFSGLNSLTKLDVSKNSLSRIQGNTFSGLRLDLLRLDDNQGLTLDAEAFENLTVSSLSMQNCGLRSLSFEVFRPLLQSGTLTTLRLTSNSLTTLDIRFEPFFRNLSFLSLAKNPFTCDCKLMWLSRTLQRKRREDNDDAFPMINDDILLIEPDDDHPICESPSRLRGKQIVTLASTDFYCGPPQMKALEVDFSSFRVGGGETVNTTAGIVIKCAAQGSPEMQLAWFQRDRWGNGLVPLSGSKHVSPGVVEVSISRSLLAKNSTGGSEELGELFTCMGIDTYGNTSADLSLRWPAFQPTSIVPSQPSDKRNSPVPPAGDADYLEVDQKSFKTDRLDEFFFMKKFTVLELIGAVVGTFTATIMLFLMGYILLYMRHRQQYPKSPSKTVYPLVSNTGLTKFPDYHVLESSPQRQFQNHLECLGNHSCDISTEKRRLMQNGNWTDSTRRGPEARTGSSVYSECPTYDLPSNHLVAPLPPLPADPPPPSPPNSTINQFGTVGGMPIVYPQSHFLDPNLAAAVANTSGNNSQSNNLLAQTLTTNAILVDMLTMQRRQHQHQLQHQQATSPNQNFRF
ncbi:unnamed protein product [Rodentolepis nana]|uniref:Ig-like domain-containing protein n=1 Tax=Rodentolepis nana TaxID=102285 RepID=A0A0R3TNY6_RODNA|nr:unnamed protein product [Rodentolepis nana]